VDDLFGTHTLVEQVMTQQPYASAKRVFWVVDNGSSHRGKAAITRLATRFPNAVMVHTPVHASWLNQVEIYFSIIQRKVVSPNEFTTLDQIETTTRRVRATLQRHRPTLPMEIHPNRSRRGPARQDRPTPAANRPTYHPSGRVINPRRTSGADH